jgi:hypothetical protein
VVTAEEDRPPVTRHSLELVHSEPLEKSPSAIQGYFKLTKKYWVLAYPDSTIELRNFNGTEPKSSSIHVPVTTMDRVAQQVTYGGNTTVGIYSVSTMEPYLTCEKVRTTQTSSPIVDLSIDYYSSLVYAALADGDILILDSKPQASHTQPLCKSEP